MTRDALPLRASHPDYFSIRITPTATDRRSRSGSFKRAHSACSPVLNGFEPLYGFDNGVIFPSTYLNNNHRSIGFIRNL